MDSKVADCKRSPIEANILNLLCPSEIHGAKNIDMKMNDSWSVSIGSTNFCICRNFKYLQYVTIFFLSKWLFPSGNLKCYFHKAAFLSYIQTPLEIFVQSQSSRLFHQNKLFHYSPIEIVFIHAVHTAFNHVWQPNRSKIITIHWDQKWNRFRLCLFKSLFFSFISLLFQSFFSTFFLFHSISIFDWWKKKRFNDHQKKHEIKTTTTKKSFNGIEHI